MTSVVNVLEVWGDLACFSRPEMKVERFSYPCITPSAARGVFDAIYAKPREFQWQIRKIEILAPISYIALRRNEVKDKVNVNAVYDWMSGKKSPEPLWADGDRDLLGTDERGRTQRQTMALRDVRYRLHGSISPWPRFQSQVRALEEQFRRRASSGKCFYQPYLGCREFPAYFQSAETGVGATPVPLDMDLGLMLYDVFDLSRQGSSGEENAISLFHARIQAGVLQVPDYASPDVLKPLRGTH